MHKDKKSIKIIGRTICFLYNISPLYFIINLILTILSGASSALTIFATKSLINGLQIGLKDRFQFTQMLMMYSFISLFVSILGIVQGYFSQKHQFVIDNRLDLVTLEKCKNLELKDFEDENTYNLISRANELGRSKIYATYINLLVIVEAVISILSIFAILVRTDKFLFALVLIVPLVSTIVNIKMGNKNYILQRKRTKDNRKLSYINYLLTNNIAIKELISYGSIDYFIQKFKTINYKILDENNKFLKLRTIWSFILGFFEEVLYIIVIIAVMISAGSGKLLIGDTVAYINSLNMIGDKIKTFLLVLSTVYNDKLFIEDFFTFLDLEQSEEAGGGEVHAIENITLNNVSFTYSLNKKNVLNNLSCEFYKGKPIAIIGKNGSGKSSLIKVLSGLYNNYDGEIKVNGINLKSFSNRSYMKKIGVIFQDYNKYELSLRENIGIAQICSLNNNEELLKVLKITGLTDVLDKFENNLDIQMGNWFGGEELSKGQWQRIAIARAILRESDVLILDEPTASLDTIMENEIFELIERLSKEKILIFITHKISNLLKFDPEIIIMKDGEIIGKGSKQILSSNREFSQLLSGEE